MENLGNKTGLAISNLWEVLFRLQEKNAPKYIFDRQVNDITDVLYSITEEFSEISNTDFNYGLTNTLFKKNLPTSAYED